MNISRKSTALAIAGLVIGTAVTGVSLASAHNRTGDTDQQPEGDQKPPQEGRMMHPGMGHKRGEMRGGELNLVPESIRSDIREQIEELSKEEREALFEAKKELDQEHRQEFEDLTGISRQDMREAHHNDTDIAQLLNDKGITEQQLTDLFTQQAHETVDQIVEQFNLSDEQKSEIEANIVDTVQKRVDHLFGK